MRSVDVHHRCLYVALIPKVSSCRSPSPHAIAPPRWLRWRVQPLWSALERAVSAMSWSRSLCGGLRVVPGRKRRSNTAAAGSSAWRRPKSKEAAEPEAVDEQVHSRCPVVRRRWRSRCADGRRTAGATSASSAGSEASERGSMSVTTSTTENSSQLNPAAVRAIGDVSDDSVQATSDTMSATNPNTAATRV